MTTDSMRSVFSRTGRFQVCLLAGIVAVTWGSTMLGQPVYDDAVLLNDISIRSFDVEAIATQPFFLRHLHYWRPLGSLLVSLGLQGGLPTLHALSLLLHVAAGVALLGVLKHSLRLPDHAALLATAMFLVSPAQTEAVAWASSLPVLAAGALSLTALRFAGTTGTRATITTQALLFAALLSHELALPAALIAGLVMSRAHDPSGSRWTPRGLYVIPTIGAWALLHGIFAGFPEVSGSRPGLVPHAIGACRVFTALLTIPLAPFSLTPFRTALGDADMSAWTLPVSGFVALLAAIAFTAFTFSKARRMQLPALLLCLPALLPAITWYGLGEFPAQDRYTYWGSAGAAAFVGLGLERSRSRLVHLAALAVVALFAALSLDQSSIWRDQGALVAHALRVMPDRATAQVMAGELALESSDSDAASRAAAHFRAALQAVQPHDAALARERLAAAHSGLGWCELAQGETPATSAAKATARFRESLAIHESPAALVGMGVANALTRRLNVARSYLHRATELAPQNARAWYNLGLVNLDAGADEQARACFRTALRYAPDLQPARDELERLR